MPDALTALLDAHSGWGQSEPRESKPRRRLKTYKTRCHFQSVRRGQADPRYCHTWVLHMPCAKEQISHAAEPPEDIACVKAVSCDLRRE